MLPLSVLLTFSFSFSFFIFSCFILPSSVGLGLTFFGESVKKCRIIYQYITLTRTIFESTVFWCVLCTLFYQETNFRTWGAYNITIVRFNTFLQTLDQLNINGLEGVNIESETTYELPKHIYGFFMSFLLTCYLCKHRLSIKSS